MVRWGRGGGVVPGGVEGGRGGGGSSSGMLRLNCGIYGNILVTMVIYKKISIHGNIFFRSKMETLEFK